MKAIAAVLLAALAMAPAAVQAQKHLDVDTPVKIADSSPYEWGMSGFDIIHIYKGAGDMTPVMRAARMDQTLVEIFARVQAPPVRPADIKVTHAGSHTYVTVRDYVLTEVFPDDAAANGTSVSAQAGIWAAAARKALPVIAPGGSRFGI